MPKQGDSNIMNLDAPAQHLASAGDQGPLIGLAALMRMAFSDVDLAPLGMQLIKRVEANPGKASANVMMDLATVLQLRGDRELAMTIQMQALRLQQVYSPPTAKGKVGIRLLAIMGPGDLMANTPLEFLLEDSDVALDMLYVAPSLPLPPVLPDHDLLFVAIGQSDHNLPLLQQIDDAIKSWPRPVLNMPSRIAMLARDRVCDLLRYVPGLRMPHTARISRQTLRQIGEARLLPGTVLGDGDFPIIARPVDSHAGQGLAKLDDAAAVADYLQTMPQSEFYVSHFVDYRGTDGLFRKYRIVLINGCPFVCHMALSEHWMIHYLNAGMAASPEKRAEEARFMANFDEDFARRHATALRVINECMQLDYLGIDCGETADGDLLIFEVDSNMIVHAIDPVDVFPYKQPQMRKVFTAFRKMLEHALSRNSP